MSSLVFPPQPASLANASKIRCDFSSPRSPSIPPELSPKVVEMSRIEAPYATLESSHFCPDVPFNNFTLAVMPVLRELPKHTLPLLQLSRRYLNLLPFHRLP
jgi:hypothetical protein